MYNKKIPKIFLFFITFSLVFSVNVKSANALLVDITRGTMEALAGLIWDVFAGFMEDRARESMEGLEQLPDEPDQSGVDILFETLENEMDDFLVRSNTLNLLRQTDDYSSVTQDIINRRDLNIRSDIESMEGFNRILDEVMRRLNETGFFDFFESNYGYTEEEFRRMLMNLLYSSVINPAVDPITNTLGGVNEDLTYELTPQFPRPGDSVDVRLVSFGINLNASQIDWFHNNSLILSGTGQVQLNDFQLNNQGNRESIVVVIRRPEGGIIEQIINIHPANIDIIYEVDTYVPPFYKGKPEYSHNSVIKFIAIPSVLDQNGRQMTQNEFTYRWYVNNQIVQESNRVGKNYFYLQDDFSGRPLNVDVDVMGVNDDFNSSEAIVVTPRDPEIILYEDHPRYGILYNRALSNNVQTTLNEISIKAAPFFFNNNNDLNFRWALNNRELVDFNRNIVTFRAESGESLLSNLSVRINNNEKVAQSAFNYFSLLVNN